MTDNYIVKTVAGTCVGFSFLLVGNAITQTFMTVPALLADFPKPGSSDHTARARLLGRQWPVCWAVGNKLIRPISTLGFLGYAYTGYAVYKDYKEHVSAKGDWRMFAVAAIMHLTTILHSAVNMQPLNNKLEALAGRASEKELGNAEAIARKWASWNKVRMVTSAIAGTFALFQLVQ